jgi:RND family efflux transporter MFP subunit
MKKFTFIFTLAALLIFSTGCGKQTDQTEETVVKKQVKIQDIVKQSEVSTSLVLSGAVTPKQYSVIRSLTPGTIEYLAPVGSDVFVGQPLFSIRDQGIESGYSNALQSLQQTNVVTSQRITQAELSVNSAKASFDLARSQYSNAVARTEQALSTAEDSTLLAYSSAYNTLNQSLIYLNEGNVSSPRYLYRDILTADEQLRTDTTFMFADALEDFSNLESFSTRISLDDDLDEIYKTLLAAKDVLDSTAVLLQNAIPSSSSLDAIQLTSARLSISGYQTQINTHISSIIASVSSIANTEISNRLSIDQAQAQLDLAEIQYNNTLVGLDNAKESAELENNMSQTQFDGAAYNYSNLSIAAPFSGTILSHYVSAGQQVSLGQELIEIGNLAIIEITIDIDVDFAKALKLNDEVIIDDQYKGIVTEVEPIGDLQSGKVSVTVQSSEAESNLVAGNTADVKFDLNYTEIDSIVVPIKSVTIEASGNYVFVLDSENKVVRKNVTLDQIFGDKVSVVSGLEEGDRLILLNGIFVSTGDEVEIIQE